MNVDILVKGRPVTKYNHEGKVFIEGRHGSNYQIKITNPSYMRRKVIVSVDGLSVMDGEPAGDGSSGYIIDGHGSIVIDGWRISDDAVRLFGFGTKDSSYSEASGQGTTNVGVIGVLVFDEEIRYRHPNICQTTPIWNGVPGYRAPTIPKPWTNEPYITCSSDSISTSAVRGRASASVNNMGTEMGEVSSSSVEAVEFRADPYSRKAFTIFYDDRKGLKARGVPIDQYKALPDAFPASSGYCRQV